MKTSLYKDKNKRKYYILNEQKTYLMKSLIKNLQKSKKFRLKVFTKLQSKSFYGSITKLHNRCTLTGRSKSVYRDFKMSRLMFRKYASQGKLASIRKASW